MKNLIVCPNCEAKGIKQNMAEVTPTGFIAIQRFHHKTYGKDYTIIGGSSFYLVCGRCGTRVYFKEQHEVHP